MTYFRNISRHRRHWKQQKYEEILPNQWVKIKIDSNF